MKEFTYSIYIITKDGNRIWWTSGQSYADCVREVDYLRKYEDTEAVILEDQQ